MKKAAILCMRVADAPFEPDDYLRSNCTVCDAPVFVSPITIQVATEAATNFDLICNQCAEEKGLDKRKIEPLTKEQEVSFLDICKQAVAKGFGQ